MEAPSPGSPPPRPPFVLGVTGTMSFPGYDPRLRNYGDLSPVAKSIHDRVHHVLAWLRGKKVPGAAVVRQLNPTGKSLQAKAPAAHESIWDAVDLGETPIVVLSSLAPGADTLVAEAALDYARSCNANVTVRAVLPFPVSIYVRSSAFVSRKDPGKTVPNQARFQAILCEIQSQPSFVRDRDVVIAQLGPDFAGDPEADLSAESPNQQPRRYLRYRAAGERIALAAHLLLAVYDETDTAKALTEGQLRDPYTTNTQATVFAMRSGTTFGLLAMPHGLGCADSGPVLRLPIDQHGTGFQHCERPLAFLYPFDSFRRRFGKRPFRDHLRELGTLPLPKSLIRPQPRPTPLTDADAHWQEDGAEVFRRIAARHAEFCSLRPAAKEAELGMAACSKVDAWDADRKLDLGAEAKAHIATLADLAAIRERAAGVARAQGGRRDTLLARLAWSILIAATMLSTYEHWAQAVVPVDTPAPFPWPRVSSCLLLSGSILLVCWSGFLFWRYRRSRAEEQRFDFRAIAEGLRVQLHWAVAGVPAEAGGEYMQRHWGELSWIRRLVTAIAWPAERFARQFASLSHAARHELLQATQLAWIRGQWADSHRKARRKEAGGHGWHLRGWALAAAGMLNVFGKLLAELLPSVEHAFHDHPFVIAAWTCAVGVALLVWHLVWGWHENQQHPDSPHPEGASSRPFVAWVFGRLHLWGAALVFGAVAFTGSAAMASVTLPTVGWPDQHGWWIILTGLLLLGGAMCLAWSERKFFAEEARASRALEVMYSAADRRLEELIRRFKAQEADETAAARTLGEIHAILFQVGKDALAENAEWLILHRTRPLEPFMAG